nr:catalase family peroxidase [Beijerinckia indica]
MIAALVLGTGFCANGMNRVAAEEAGIETKLIDAMNTLFGKHPGLRANHAKGLVTQGVFKPSPEAAGISKAILFKGESIPVTLRFSDATGVPLIPDGSPNANPHGAAIKYHLPDGSETDMVLVSFKFFPIGTAEDFLTLLQAIAASPPDAAKPTALERFAASHPSVAAANATLATPASFAEEHYFGINAFIFTDAKGKTQAVRYQLVPDKLAHLSAEEAAKRAPDFLKTELTERLAKTPALFHLKAQLAAQGDDTKDPSKPWPDDRKIIDLGTITIEKIVPDSATAEKALLYLPGQVTEGIDVSDDPMIGIRDSSYAVSFSRRSQ